MTSKTIPFRTRLRLVWLILSSTPVEVSVTMEGYEVPKGEAQDALNADIDRAIADSGSHQAGVRYMANALADMGYRKVALPRLTYRGDL